MVKSKITIEQLLFESGGSGWVHEGWLMQGPSDRSKIRVCVKLVSINMHALSIHICSRSYMCDYLITMHSIKWNKMEHHIPLGLGLRHFNSWVYVV